MFAVVAAPVVVVVVVVVAFATDRGNQFRPGRLTLANDRLEARGRKMRIMVLNCVLCD